MRRQREGERIDDSINDDRAILVRKSGSEPFSDVARFLDADAFRAHRFGDLREVGTLELHSKRDHPGLLHLDIDEVEGSVVENDLDHGSFSLHLGQEVAQREHGEPAVPA